MLTRLLFCLLFMAPLPTALAAGSRDATLDAGLQACEVNGIRACLRIWYPDRPEWVTRFEDGIREKTLGLGDITGTEVVTSQTLSSQVVRYYVVVYYDQAPLWLRIDRYTVGIKQRFLPLEYSLKPEDILPEDLVGK